MTEDVEIRMFCTFQPCPNFAVGEILANELKLPVCQTHRDIYEKLNNQDPIYQTQLPFV